MSARENSRAEREWPGHHGGTFRDKRTGRPVRFYIWTPSDFLRDNRLSVDARFLLLILRSFTADFNKPAYPTYGTLQNITGWGRNKVVRVRKELQDKTEIEIRQDRKRGRYGPNEYYLPRWLFPDRVPHSGLR